MNALFYRDPAAMARLYARLGEQVKSYHRHYHMGDNTSVPTETARELLESMVYTLKLTPGGTLEAGQKLLEQRLALAKERHRLVRTTAPEWESQCRWETIAALGHYLERYDYLHFAHRGPEGLDYPLLVAVPEELQGLDRAVFYLNCLWYENQLLHAMDEAARGSWENRIPDYWGIPLNLCEQPLIQLLGRQLLGLPLSESELSDADRRALAPLLREQTKERLQMQAAGLCKKLEISDPNAAAYACAAADSLYPRLTAALPTGDLSHIFL